MIPKDAIDILKDIQNNLEEKDFLDRCALDMAIESLKEQRPHGEWIPCKSTRNGQVTNIDYKCSECSHHKDRPFPYCEICGAKMERR